MRALAMAIAMSATACQLVFDLSEPSEAPDDAPGDRQLIPHIPAPIAIGSGDFILRSGTIDTAANSIGIEQEGVEHEIVAQSSGTNVMLIRARDVTFEGTVTVRGTLPLIIFAQRITIETLDASASFAMPGPGAIAPNGGPGGFAPGNNAGGGGGGFGTPGAEGGRAGDLGTGCSFMANAGTAGLSYNDDELSALEGGSGGGSGGGVAGTANECSTPGGGGGGAVQLSALDRITISVGVHASGGGGAGGVVCNGVVSHGGAGGGSGGAIYLDAPMLVLTGAITANGGGGGGGGGTQGLGGCVGPSDTAAGNSGSNGRPDAMPAGGGVGGAASCSKNGGNGAAGLVSAMSGGEIGCDGSAGGGGGGGGRIVLRGVVVGGLTISPHPVTLLR